MRARLVLPLAMLIAACGGRAPLVSLAPPEVAHSASDYSEVRQRWTRSGRIIRTLDTTLHVFATLLSPDFTSAYVARRAELFHLSNTDRAALSAALAEDTSRHYVFFVSAATDDWKWNDFDSKSSVWHLVLLTDLGDQVAPAQIPGDSITPTVTELFPYVGAFHRIYWVRFPKNLPDGRPLVRSETRSLRLLFAGPLGQTELEWRFR